MAQYVINKTQIPWKLSTDNKTWKLHALYF